MCSAEVLKNTSLKQHVNDDIMWDTAEYIHIYLYPIQEYVHFYSGTKSMILRVQLQRQNQVFSISVNHSIEQIRENIKPQWPQSTFITDAYQS